MLRRDRHRAVLLLTPGNAKLSIAELNYRSDARFRGILCIGFDLRVGIEHPVCGHHPRLTASADPSGHLLLYYHTQNIILQNQHVGRWFAGAVQFTAGLGKLLETQRTNKEMNIA